MIKLLLRHHLLETAINSAFNKVFINFQRIPNGEKIETNALYSSITIKYLHGDSNVHIKTTFYNCMLSFSHDNWYTAETEATKHEFNTIQDYMSYINWYGGSIYGNYITLNPSNLSITFGKKEYYALCSSDIISVSR